MFDNYGIKDVFYGLWKYKFYIAIISYFRYIVNSFIS